jgi:hypothetical protein
MLVVIIGSSIFSKKLGFFSIIVLAQAVLKVSGLSVPMIWRNEKRIQYSVTKRPSSQLYMGRTPKKGIPLICPPGNLPSPSIRSY